MRLIRPQGLRCGFFTPVGSSIHLLSTVPYILRLIRQAQTLLLCMHSTPRRENYSGTLNPMMPSRFHLVRSSMVLFTALPRVRSIASVYCGPSVRMMVLCSGASWGACGQRGTRQPMLKEELLLTP